MSENSVFTNNLDLVPEGGSCCNGDISTATAVAYLPSCRLPKYVLALKGLGVERYDSYIADGHSEYFGQGGHRVISSPVHEMLTVAETSQRETCVQHLRWHQQRETTYLEMSRGLAQSGIEKWTVDTGRMTITFYDKAGNELLVEQIK